MLRIPPSQRYTSSGLLHPSSLLQQKTSPKQKAVLVKTAVTLQFKSNLCAHAEKNLIFGPVCCGAWLFPLSSIPLNAVE